MANQMTDDDVSLPGPVPVAESPPRYSTSKDLMLTPEKKRSTRAAGSLFHERTVQDTPLERPTINSSRKIVPSLQGTAFDEREAVETHLKEEKSRHRLIYKGSRALNYPHQAVRYTNLTSLQVNSNSTSDMKQRSKPSCPGQLTARKSSPNQALQDLFSDDLISEASDWSVDVPLPPTGSTPVSPDRALQLYQHFYPPQFGN